MPVYRNNYFNNVRQLTLARQALLPTREFVLARLKHFSDRETAQAFETRKSITPNPPDLRIAFNKLTNSIRARMGEITRLSDLPEYLYAVRNGVNESGSGMDAFISEYVLPELLTAGAVGVFCNRDAVPDTLAGEAPKPYLTVIPFEDIINHTYTDGVLTALTLRAQEPTYNLGYQNGTTTIFEEFKLVGSTVTKTVTALGTKGDSIPVTSVLNVDFIPFAMVAIKESPVCNAVDTHDALLQLSSSDFLFLNKSNYPIYTEQYDIKTELQQQQFEKSRQSRPTATEGGEAPKKSNDDVLVGTTTGRRYPVGAERPGFIAPPIEHLEASSVKQQDLIKKINQIMGVEALEVDDVKKSADSKTQDKETLVGFVQTIFDALSNLENKLAGFWHSYYSAGDNFAVIYPQTFDLRSEKTRLEHSKDKIGIRDNIASQTARRLITLEAIRDALPRISAADIKKIEAELSSATLHLSVTPLASMLDKQGIHPSHAIRSLGLPESDVQKVLDYNKERQEMIQVAQTGEMNGGPGSKGRPDEGKGELE
jgi:hypothetical protein